MIAVAALPAITESGLPIRFSPRSVFEDAARTIFSIEGGFATSSPPFPQFRLQLLQLFLIYQDRRICASVWRHERSMSRQLRSAYRPRTDKKSL
jgi:hypothetical protein